MEVMMNTLMKRVLALAVAVTVTTSAVYADAENHPKPDGLIGLVQNFKTFAGTKMNSFAAFMRKSVAEFGKTSSQPKPTTIQFAVNTNNVYLQKARSLFKGFGSKVSAYMAKFQNRNNK
jgi:hypothetical protein